MANKETKSVDTQKLLLRSLVENVYDAQSVRIAIGNRLIASLRSLGVVDASDSEDKGKDMDKDAKEAQDNKILVKVLNEFKQVSTIYAEQFGNKGSISKALEQANATNIYVRTELTYSMVETFTSMSLTEKKMVDLCTKEVHKHPLWEAFFKDVRGCGPMMAAVCIAYFDPYKARWPASFWKYAGLDVVTDENGSHGRTRGDTVMVKYINREGKEAEKRSISYNPVVKTKLIGVLGPSFLRAGKEAKYAKLYYDYKNRLQNRPDCADLRAIVIHRRAIRYAVKIFLKDLWNVWRTLEGLPVGEDYAVAKLGMSEHHDPRNKVSVSDDDIVNLAAGINPIKL